MAKTRVDVRLVELGLVESRSKAQALIMAGSVFAGTKRIEKPGQNVGYSMQTNGTQLDDEWGAFLKEYKLNGKIYRPEVQHFQADGVSPSHLKLMRHAMWRTINDSAGTGSSALIPGFDVCGKTGTAQTVTFRTKDDRKEKRYQNAWFAGFAPFQRPEVAIVVLLEHAGHGGEAAAPIARQILEAYLESPVREQILDAI